ncbi:MEDS domain-containing protein [Streptomyces sp. NPDC048416]|uniref:MEDS domain-containing protein n=1 Tax=Streptomyces sp. NPDC048416 TaxID=3365546 RepID=UPI003711DCF8
MFTSDGPETRAPDGEHSFFSYDDDAECAAAVVGAVRAGLHSGRRVLCAVDTAPGAALDALRRGGVDVSAAQDSGRLSVVSSQEFPRPRLPFDPDRVIPLLRSACAEALEDGLPGLALVEDRTWCAREVPGAERLLEYELRLEREVYATLPVTGLCTADRRVVPEPTLGLLRGAHLSPAPGEGQGLPFTVTALRDQAGARLTGSADHDSRSALIAALAAVSGIPGPTVRLDLSRTTFLDTGSVAALLTATDHLRLQGRRLLLHNPPYSLRRVMQLFPDECAALEVPA